MKNKFAKLNIFPRYSYLPFALIVLVHMAVYFGTKPLTANAVHRSVAFAIDSLIPFAPEWSLIYVTTFFFWMIGLLVMMLQDREVCFKLFTAAMIGELICAAFFVLVPTQIARPAITTDAFYEQILVLVYSSDEPVNLFPSMHCMFSYMIFRGLFYCKGVSKTNIVFAGIFTALICASTLFIKQHFAVDVVAGIVLGEISLGIGLRTEAWRAIDSLDDSICQYIV